MINKIIIHTDGGSRGNPGPAAIGAVIEDDKGVVLDERAKFLGIATNNQAEYKAVIEALLCIKEEAEKYKDVKEIEFYLDSELVVKQLRGEYKMKNPGLRPLKEEIERMLGEMILGKPGLKISFVHVRRHLNKRADELLNMKLDEQK